MALRRPVFLALLVAAVGAAACSGAAEGGAADPPVTVATTQSRSTTVAPTQPPSTTTVATTAPPPTRAPPGTTTRPPGSSQLITREIWLFPGPTHFEGDVLSAHVPLDLFADHLGAVTVVVDGETIESEARLGRDPLLGSYISVPDVLDTRTAAGSHTIAITAEIDGEPLQVAAEFAVLPADETPRQETDATWASEETTCCTVHYVERSAAARDLDEITEMVEDSAIIVETALGVELPRLDMVLLDVLWGNGGYAGAHEVAISYLDRDFGPNTSETAGMTFVHELTHAGSRQLEGDAPWPLDEALAVYVAGGHFKPENLPARAGALATRGDLLPLAEFLDDFDHLQHESRYVQAGALATYLVETYGWDRFLAFYATPNTNPRVSLWFDRAAQSVFDADLEEIQAGFSAWVASQDPTLEARDLDLTITLQEIRRTYQAEYAPYQSGFLQGSVVAVGDPSVALRETRRPANVATEALFGWAQRLIVEGELDLAAQVVDELDHIVSGGVLDQGFGADALRIAERLDSRGFELLSIDFDGDTAAAQATAEPPVVVDFLAHLTGEDLDLIGPLTETS